MNTPISIWLSPPTLIIGLLLFSGVINANPTATRAPVVKLALEESQGTQTIYQTTRSSFENTDVGLPPDPGDTGKQTLAGVDSDADGVRDDIQRYIYFTYPDSEKTQAALTEVAKQYQAILLQAADADAAFLHATKMARHGECLDYIEGEAAANILAALHAEYLNTRERSLAYIQYNSTLSGEIIIGKPLAEWKNSCAFDVDPIEGN